MKLLKSLILTVGCFSLLSVPAVAQDYSKDPVPEPRQKKFKQSAVPQPASSGIRPRVFINPGHGGHDSDDRPTPFFNEGTQQREPYYESDSNLSGGIAMRDILRSKGYEVYMSRVDNDTEDDLNLFEVSQLALNSGADVFFSIHSNATGNSKRVNFPFALYRGTDKKNATEGSRRLAELSTKYLALSEATSFTRGPLVRGDWSFYDWGYGVGLGVLRWNKLAGILVENCFHDYLIERERLLNKDYAWSMAWLNSCALDEYFAMSGSKNGVVAGLARYDYARRGKRQTSFGKDYYQPVNNLPVELCDLDGNVVATYQIDSYNNGFYCFTNIAPGSYTVEMDGVESHEVVVRANKTTYCNVEIVTQKQLPDEVDDGITVVHSGDNSEEYTAPTDDEEERQ